jgi:predicted nicotinamide N-methyase
MKIKVAPSDYISSKGTPKKVEIPAAAETLVKQLSRKYELDFEAVPVKGKLLHFLHVADIEPLVKGKDVFEHAEEFPFWVKIWEASVMMANFMASLKPEPGQRILELGAGLAVPGIAAAIGGHNVTVTDYEDEILDFVRVSSLVNECHENVTTARLDWLDPDVEGLGKFDIIIGSEILFHEKFFAPLYKVINSLIAENGIVFMAHNRERRSLAPFLKLCSEHFDIAAQKKTLVVGRKKVDIILNRLVKKLIAE